MCFLAIFVCCAGVAMAKLLGRSPLQPKALHAVSATASALLVKLVRVGSPKGIEMSDCLPIGTPKRIEVRDIISKYECFSRFSGVH